MNNPKVLFYADPHPIRNNPMTFSEAAYKMSRLAQENHFAGVEWRLFSNKFIIDRIRGITPESALILPTPDEEAKIASFMHEWNEDAVERRNDLVSGIGEVADFYSTVLRRIKSEFDFTHIVLWSDNGAVRNFALDSGIGVVHIELGPTRAPFPSTLYFDVFGTNGYSTASNSRISDVSRLDPAPIDSWLSDTTGSNKNSTAREMAFRPVADNLVYLTEKPYVVVALQLVDDLNTVLHSPYDTPEDFLKHILPRLFDLGFHVVVKGHPGVSGRPLNLVHETRALAYAESFGDRVTILDRRMPPTEFLPVCAGAKAVASINSAVSCEAWLIGVPGLVFGEAAYDVDGLLKKAGEEFLSSGSINVPDINLAFDFLFRHYLVPDDDNYLSRTLNKIINCFDFSREMRDYTSFLKESFDHTERLILNTHTFVDRRNRVHNSVRTGNLRRTGLIYHIDELRFENRSVFIAGWVGRAGSHDPHPVEIAILAGETILGLYGLNNRPDVVAVHRQVATLNGFKIEIYLPEGISPRELRMIAVNSDETFAEIHMYRTALRNKLIAKLKAFGMSNGISFVRRVRLGGDT